MNILITGSTGQLGAEIKNLSQNEPHQFFFTGSDEIDICDFDTVEQFFKTNNIQACVNCAAYTAVDKAETEQELAHKINVLGTGNLAKACAQNNAILIHISTDFVFDGKAYRPITEDTAVNPTSIYGKTKAEGEQKALEYNTRTYIIRTAWLYSQYGNNFVKTMLRLGNERTEIGVIFDQVGTPTYAADLAQVILSILNQSKTPYGIYHYSNEGVASWYDFAKAIFELRGLAINVKALNTEEYPTPAARPAYSVLNKNKIKKTFNITIPYWRDSLKTCLDQIK